MKNGVNVILVAIIFLSTILIGCTSNQNEDNNYEDIFESDVVNLLNYSINLNENKSGTIIEANIDGIIENNVDRIITVNITVEFYNSNDDLLGKDWYTIHDMPIGYSTNFEIKYKEENVADFDNIKIQAIEMVK